MSKQLTQHQRKKAVGLLNKIIVAFHTQAVGTKKARGGHRALELYLGKPASTMCNFFKERGYNGVIPSAWCFKLAKAGNEKGVKYRNKPLTMADFRPDEYGE